MKLLLSALISLAVMVSAPLSAKDTDAPENIGPKVGQPLPLKITLKDQTGTMRSLSKMAGEQGTVLVFYRSADWCPYCRAQLIDLEQNASSTIAQKGYSLVGVSYDNVETLDQFSRKFSITFPLLSDKGSKVIDALNLRNVGYKGMKKYDGAPYPIVIILDAQGVVKANLFEKSYRKRPKISEILAAL